MPEIPLIGAESRAGAYRPRPRRIAGEHRLIIQLIRDIDSRVERSIVFIWPPAPTLIQPGQLAAVSNAIVAASAAARIQLAAIRAGEP